MRWKKDNQELQSKQKKWNEKLTFGINNKKIKNWTKYFNTLDFSAWFASVAVKPNQVDISVVNIMQPIELKHFFAIWCNYQMKWYWHTTINCGYFRLLKPII